MKLCERRNRWSTLAAVLMGLVASAAHAYDEDHVQAHLQPFFGLYVGGYQNNTDDLNNILASKKNDFLPILPNAGVSLGVAYDRFHAGFSIGYQMPNYNDLSDAERKANGFTVDTIAYGVNLDKCPDSAKCYYKAGTKQYLAFKDFNYDLIPMELFAEATVFKNSSYVNFLMGGSVGLAYMTLVNPDPLHVVQSGDTAKYYYGTGGRNGGDRQSLFLFTGYVGVRINIAERLNLQGSVGWRGLFTDEVYSADCDCYLSRNVVENQVVDATTGEVTSIAAGGSGKYRLDLSGAFLRADLRWTFASQAEKDADRTSMRRQALDDARIASAYRLR